MQLVFIEIAVGENKAQLRLFFFFGKPFGHFIPSMNKYLLSTYFMMQGHFPGIIDKMKFLSRPVWNPKPTIC